MEIIYAILILIGVSGLWTFLITLSQKLKNNT